MTQTGNMGARVLQDVDDAIRILFEIDRFDARDQMQTALSGQTVPFSFGSFPRDIWSNVPAARVILFFEEHGVRLLRVLTDRGTEYFGNREHHEYQLYLAIEDIDHTRTKARHPQTNGICERFRRTIQDEFYSVGFRKKLYRKLDELQADVDDWIKEYNETRPHSGRHCFGRTPLQTFKDSKHLADQKMIDSLSSKEGISGTLERGDKA